MSKQNNLTGERLARLETDIAYIKDSLLKINEYLQLNSPKSILDETDLRYASKWTEKFAWGFCGATLLAVLFAVLRLVVI